MAAKKKTKKEQTLAEFKAWLEGAESLQPKNWCPDATQWKLIRGMINNITIPEAEWSEPEPAFIPYQDPRPIPRQEQPFMPAPEQPNLPNIEISPAAQQLLDGGAISGGIDEDGDYNSGFE